MGRRLAILVFLCLTLLLGLLFPKAWERAASREEALPPGVATPGQCLLRVWLMEDSLSASSYIKRQAAKLEKWKPGVSVYLRTARPEELVQPEAVLPDVILFKPGVIKEPQTLFLPLAGTFPLSDGALRAGRWQGLQYALPICMEGYVLAYDAALTGAASATPAPTPLLGIGVAPSATAALEGEAVFGDLLSAISLSSKDKSGVSSFHCAAGLPLLLFSSLAGGREGLNGFSLHAGFGEVSQSAVFSDFQSGRCYAAVLTARQFASLAGQGRNCAYFSMPVPATDLYLAAGIVPGNRQELALDFLQALLSPEGQQDLAQSGLMAISRAATLYGGDPVLHRAEAGLKGDLILPNAFSMEAQTLKIMALSAFANGSDLSAAFESIR